MIPISIKKIIFYLIIISFFITVILSMSGYYETELQKKMILTNEAIETFENDLKSGKEIDINNYVELNKKDYDNTFTKTGRYISKKTEKFFSKIINQTLKIIIKAIEE